MNIENLMESPLPDLRKLLKKYNFSIEQEANLIWKVTYKFPNGPDDFFGETRSFTLPHYMNGQNERFAILYTLRRYVD